MGKRFPEYVVNPSDIVNEYGADTLRLYEMFMGPLEASKPWSNDGVDGAHKFLERVYRLVTSEEYTKRFTNEYNNSLEKIYHQTVKKVTADYEALSFNTAISQMMIFVNEAYKAPVIYKGFIEGLVKLLSPVCPHICSEMWEILGNIDCLATASWPTYDESKLIDNEITYAISVNGKLRDKALIDANASQEEVKKIALSLEKLRPILMVMKLLR